MIRQLAVIILLMTMGHASYGKIFNTSYVSFEIPENWKCKSFGTDWVCHSTLSKQEKESMIILTAKIAGSLDNFQAYENFLRQPREGYTRAKQPFKSKVIHTKKVFINNQPWVDSFHKESEIPSYYTRYVVTTCCKNDPSKLAILVTYSAHTNHYTKYASDFLKSINSLRVLNVKKAISKMKALGTGESLGSVSSYMEDLLDDENFEGDGNREGSFFGLSGFQFGFLILIVLGAIAYIARKKLGNKRKRRKEKRRSRRR